MAISGSQHPLKVNYSILNIIHLWVNKILVVVVQTVVILFGVRVYSCVLVTCIGSTRIYICSASFEMCIDIKKIICFTKTPCVRLFKEKFVTI